MTRHMDKKHPDHPQTKSALMMAKSRAEAKGRAAPPAAARAGASGGGGAGQ